MLQAPANDLKISHDIRPWNRCQTQQHLATRVRQHVPLNLLNEDQRALRPRRGRPPKNREDVSLKSSSVVRPPASSRKYKRECNTRYIYNWLRFFYCKTSCHKYIVLWQRFQDRMSWDIFKSIAGAWRTPEHQNTRTLSPKLCVQVKAKTLKLFPPD